MKKQIITLSLLVIGFVFGSSVLTALGQTGVNRPWTGPSSTAPNCIVSPLSDPEYNEGCNPPINTGLSDQTKTGILRLVDLVVGRLNVLNDTPAVGDVLTAKDSLGTVEWKAPAMGFSNFQAYVTPGNPTFAIPPGTTKILVEAWGGGEDGKNTYSGTGGGYGRGIIPITNETSCSVVVGDSVSRNNSNADLAPFGVSSVTCGSKNITATGGLTTGGGSATASAGVTSFVSFTGGKGFRYLHDITGNVTTPSEKHFYQTGGNGAQGGQGGVGLQPAQAPGGGGGSNGELGGGGEGAPGRVIIWY